MCMSELDDVSISDAMHSGYEDAQAQRDKDGANGGQPPKQKEEEPNAKPGEPDGKGDGSPDPGSPPPTPGEKKPEDPNAPPGKPADNQPQVDPDKGVYVGEYTAERFNGLMGQWQKDRTEMLRLQAEEAKWKQNNANPPAPAQPPGNPPAPIKDEDIIIPPELKNATPEEQEGFRVMMRSVLSAQRASLEQTQQKMIDQVLGKVTDKLSEPERKKAEETTRVMQEMEGLTGEFGKDFTENKKAIIDFAVEHQYPLGTLRQATIAWLQINKLKGGKKDVANFEKDKKDQGNIPSPGTPRTGVIPKFDPEKDGEKSLSELMKEGYNA